jgi:hypothetical protein
MQRCTVMATALALCAGEASAQQLSVHARDVSVRSTAPAVATPTRPWGAPPAGGGAWGAWPRGDAWRGGSRTPATPFTAQGQVAAVGQPFPVGVVPSRGWSEPQRVGSPGGAWYPPRVVVVLLPTCDAWGNCWRQPTQVTAVWHGQWQRYVWIDAAGRYWPI